MKLLGFLLGLAAATALHTLGARLTAGFPAVFDLYLVLVVYNSLSSPVGWSTAAGSAAGLVRDTLSGGLYGLHGFADTLVAYLAARLRERLVIQKPLQVGLLFALAAAAQLVVLATLQFLLVSGAELPGLGALAARMVTCGVLGPLLLLLDLRLRTSVGRWREHRRRRLKMALWRS